MKPNTNRAAIIDLYQKGFAQAEIVRRLLVPQRTVSHAIKRFNELGTDADRAGRGRKRTVCTSKNKKIIKKRLQRNPRRSVRKMAKETGISRTSVQRMVEDDLDMKAYKHREVQFLTPANKKVRLQRCKKLLERAEGKLMLFTDEKIFTVEPVLNRQNDRIYSTVSPGESRLVGRRQHPASVMVWAGICVTGKTPLVFVEKGAKIDQKYYIEEILEKEVLPWSEEHFEEDWIFQQDSAPAHRAKRTQAWCEENFPDFLTVKEWPPYSPDLNPMDYSVWSILESRVCTTRFSSVAALKKKLLQEWDKITVEELRPICENFEKRLKLCIKAKGGYFETE